MHCTRTYRFERTARTLLWIVVVKETDRECCVYTSRSVEIQSSASRTSVVWKALMSELARRFMSFGARLTHGFVLANLLKWYHAISCQFDDQQNDELSVVSQSILGASMNLRCSSSLCLLRTEDEHNKCLINVWTVKFTKQCSKVNPWNPVTVWSLYQMLSTKLFQ